MDMQTPAVKFHRQWVRIVLLMIACFAGQLKSTAASEDTKEDTMDLVSIAKEIRGEIVQIVMPLLNGKQALGSGFWVHQSGYVATCDSVISLV
jgi:hypothetical protein